MELKFFYKTALFVFVLSATTLIDDISGKSTYDNTPIQIQSRIGTLDLNSSSCVDANPFPDPTDNTQYYQCFDVSGWVIIHFQCPPGGEYDAPSGSCVEVLATSGPPTEITTEPATELPTEPATEITTEPPTELPTEPATEITTEPPTELPTEPATEITTEPPIEITTELSTTTEEELSTTTEDDLSSTTGSTFETTPESSSTSESSSTPDQTSVITTEEVSSTTELPTSDLSTTELSTTESEISTTEEPTDAPTSTTPSTTTTPSPYICTVEGVSPDPFDPTKYYRCVLINGQFYFYIFTCPPTACFNPATKLCAYNFCSTLTTTTTTTTAVPITSTQPATTASPPPVTCTTAGVFPYPGDCYQYYRCISNPPSSWYIYIFTCPTGSYFDTPSLMCVVGQCPIGTGPTTPSASTTTTIATTTPITTTTTLAPILTTTAPPPFTCTTNGTFPNPANCNQYYRCTYVSGTLYLTLMSCPGGAYYDASAKLCVVGPCPSPTTTTASATTTTTELATTTLGTTTPSTNPLLPEITCTTPGTFPNPEDPCREYYICQQSGSTWYVYIFSCPTGMYFDTSGCIIGTCPIIENLDPSSLEPDTTTQLTTTTQITTTTPFPCPSTGYFPSSNCQKYWNCVSIGGTITPISVQCPQSYYFDATKKLCVSGTC